MSNYKQMLGRLGEDMAAEYFIKHNYKILERNYRCRLGEIDLIVLGKNGIEPVLVFVEVKTRRSLNYGTPAESITWKKQNKIRKVAAWYMADHPESKGWNIRFDAILILKNQGNGENYDLEHISNAF